MVFELPNGIISSGKEHMKIFGFSNQPKKLEREILSKVVRRRLEEDRLKSQGLIAFIISMILFGVASWVGDNTIGRIFLGVALILFAFSIFGCC